MTATHSIASTVLVAIDISKHRHEVLIGYIILEASIACFVAARLIAQDQQAADFFDQRKAKMPSTS